MRPRSPRTPSTPEAECFVASTAHLLMPSHQLVIELVFLPCLPQFLGILGVVWRLCLCPQVMLSALCFVPRLQAYRLCRREYLNLASFIFMQGPRTVIICHTGLVLANLRDVTPAVPRLTGQGCTVLVTMRNISTRQQVSHKLRGFWVQIFSDFSAMACCVKGVHSEGIPGIQGCNTLKDVEERSRDC